jgi:hypothetical protein
MTGSEVAANVNAASALFASAACRNTSRAAARSPLRINSCPRLSKIAISSWEGATFGSRATPVRSIPTGGRSPVSCDNAGNDDCPNPTTSTTTATMSVAIPPVTTSRDLRLRSGGGSRERVLIWRYLKRTRRLLGRYSFGDCILQASTGTPNTTATNAPRHQSCRRVWRQHHPKDVESITAHQPYCCDIYHFLQFLFLRDVTACAAASVIAVVATAPRTTRQRLMDVLKKPVRRTRISSTGQVGRWQQGPSHPNLPRLSEPPRSVSDCLKDCEVDDIDNVSRNSFCPT